MYTFRASRVPDPLRVSRRVGWGFHPDEVVVDTLPLRKVAHHTRARRAEHGQVWSLEASKETQNLCSIIVNDGPTIPLTPFPPCHFPVLGHPAKEMREYPPPVATTTRPLPPELCGPSRSSRCVHVLSRRALVGIAAATFPAYKYSTMLIYRDNRHANTNCGTVM